MKRLFILTGFMWITTSCSTIAPDSECYVEPTSRSYRQDLSTTSARSMKADSLLASFLKIEDNQYRLDLTENEALSLGIPAEKYAEAINMVENVNYDLRLAMESGSQIIFAEENDGEIQKNLIGLNSIKTRSEVLPDKQVQFSWGSLSDIFPTEFRFSGTWGLELRAGSTSLVWSATFKESSKGINTTLSGYYPFAVNASTTVSAGLSDDSGYIYWRWEVSKGSGDASKTLVSFWSAPKK